MKTIGITRELHIPGPVGEAVYVFAPTYCHPQGTELLELVRHEAFAVMPDGGRQYYSGYIGRRGSKDNGRNWTVCPGAMRMASERLAGEQSYPFGFTLLENRDRLVEFSSSYQLDLAEPMFGIGNRIQRTYRSFCRISRDGGQTWGDRCQIVDSRPEFDAVHWAPGVEYGQTGGAAEGQRVFLPDGALVIPFGVYHPVAPAEDISERVKECYSEVVCAQARLAPDGARLEWRFGDPIRVPFPIAAGGCCESAVASLGGDRLFLTMRCQGDEGCGIHSTRQTVVSEDGGLTWSDPEPLRYDDGEIVWTPAAVHQFFRSTKNGRTYLLANLLSDPVYGQVPRYPLHIAELDVERRRVRRNTVQVIQDRPPGAPIDRRYTNWGQYEERGTGDLILVMPEMPRDKNYEEMQPEDFGADCIRFRLVLPDP